MHLTQLMLVLELQGVSSEIILAAYLNQIKDPRPHNNPPKTSFFNPDQEK